MLEEQEREEDFDFHFRSGDLMQHNVFIEETITGDDFNDAQIDGSILLGLLHGTNYVWKIGETPDKERVKYYIIKGEETPIGLLEMIWETTSGLPSGTTLEGEDIASFIVEKLDLEI